MTRMEDAMSETMLRKQIAGSDITHDDLTRLRTAVVYSRIPSKQDRIEISQCLGVLREILDEARK